MLRALPLALALALFGCRTTAPAQRRAPVEVTALSASFPSSDRGELRLSLDVENRENLAAAITSVSWELWLQGRWFATGTHAVQAPLAPSGRRAVELVIPVAFRKLEVRSEPARVEVAVRGAVEVSFAGDARRLPFESSRRIEADGVPVLATPLDEE